MKASRPPSSLRSQLLARALVIAVVPLLVLGLVALASLWQLGATADQRIDTAREGVLDAEARRLATRTTAIGRQLQNALARQELELAAWATTDQVVGGLDGGLNEAEQVLTTILATDPDVIDLHITDANGLVLGGTSVQRTGAQSGDPAWVEAWENSSGFGGLVVDQARNRHVLTMAARIDDPVRGPQGVLMATLSTDFVRALTDLAVEEGPEGLAIAVIAETGDGVADTATDHDLGVLDGTGASRPAEVPAAGTDDVYGQEGDILYAASNERIRSIEGTDGPSDEWAIVLTRPVAAAVAPTTELDVLSATIGDAQTQLLLLVGFVLLFAALAAILLMTSTAGRIIGPLADLTAQAGYAEQHGLPAAVEQVLLGDVSPANAAARAHVDVTGPSEVADLARSLNAAQETALHLAAEQAAERRLTVEMIGNLGRRNQALVNQQLRFIDGLERSEADPERLAALFRLDHLATRLRRSAQSFLVIAGERDYALRISPVRIEMIVQGALGEVEHYERVDADDLEPMAVIGDAAVDVSHALAELIDNALAFSPPESLVSIRGTLAPNGYLLRITDRGAGMMTGDLNEANAALAGRLELHHRAAAGLGLIVTARLAARTGVQVRLVTNPDGRGLTAEMAVPADLIRPAAVAPPLPEPEREANEIPIPPQHRETEQLPVVVIDTARTADPADEWADDGDDGDDDERLDAPVDDVEPFHHELATSGRFDTSGELDLIDTVDTLTDAEDDDRPRFDPDHELAAASGDDRPKNDDNPDADMATDDDHDERPESDDHEDESRRSDEIVEPRWQDDERDHIDGETPIELQTVDGFFGFPPPTTPPIEVSAAAEEPASAPIEQQATMTVRLEGAGPRRSTGQRPTAVEPTLSTLSGFAPPTASSTDAHPSTDAAVEPTTRPPTVRRRTSRRKEAPATAPATGRNTAGRRRRALATEGGRQEADVVADQVRNRWRNFQRGRRSAQSPAANGAPAGDADHNDGGRR
ncbi:MAG: ATP-binding protein [Actinomycetota bacterium]